MISKKSSDLGENEVMDDNQFCWIPEQVEKVQLQQFIRGLQSSDDISVQIIGLEKGNFRNGKLGFPIHAINP